MVAGGGRAPGSSKAWRYQVYLPSPETHGPQTQGSVAPPPGRSTSAALGSSKFWSCMKAICLRPRLLPGRTTLTARLSATCSALGCGVRTVRRGSCSDTEVLSQACASGRSGVREGTALGTAPPRAAQKPWPWRLGCTGSRAVGGQGGWRVAHEGRRSG